MILFCSIARGNVYFYGNTAILNAQCSPGEDQLISYYPQNFIQSDIPYILSPLLAQYLRASLAMSSIRRNFSTTARALLQFIWKGTGSNSQYEERITAKLAKNSKLVDADKVELAYVSRKVSQRY